MTAQLTIRENLIGMHTTLMDLANELCKADATGTVDMGISPSTIVQQGIKRYQVDIVLEAKLTITRLEDEPPEVKEDRAAVAVGRLFDVAAPAEAYEGDSGASRESPSRLRGR